MANYKFPPFVKQVDDAVLFAGKGEFVFYIPEIYFERNNAIIEGEVINLIGILDYAVFDEKGKTSGLKRFQLPTAFVSKPSKIEKKKNVKLTKNTDPQDYRLLHYYENDPILVTIRLVQDIANTEAFFNIFKAGKLPTTIPYDRLQDYFTESLQLNGSKFGVSLQIFGIVISEFCRDPHNLKKAFRHTNFTDQTAYTTINITDIPKYISPYASITSENWDNAVIGAITNDDNKRSPVEKMLMEADSD